MSQNGFRGGLEEWASGPFPKHSEDFQLVYWPGLGRFVFGDKQSKIVADLWSAWDKGLPGVDQRALLRAADSDGTRVRDLFRFHDAWGKLIVPGLARGSYSLPSLNDSPQILRPLKSASARIESPNGDLPTSHPAASADALASVLAGLPALLEEGRPLRMILERNGFVLELTVRQQESSDSPKATKKLRSTDRNFSDEPDDPDSEPATDDEETENAVLEVLRQSSSRLSLGELFAALPNAARSDVKVATQRLVLAGQLRNGDGFYSIR